MDVVYTVLGLLFVALDAIQSALSKAFTDAGGWTPLVALVALMIAIGAALHAHEAHTKAEALTEKLEEMEQKREEEEEARTREAMIAATIERYGVSEEALRAEGGTLLDILNDPGISEEAKWMTIVTDPVERERRRAKRAATEEPPSKPAPANE